MVYPSGSWRCIFFVKLYRIPSVIWRAVALVRWGFHKFDKRDPSDVIGKPTRTRRKSDDLSIAQMTRWSWEIQNSPSEERLKSHKKLDTSPLEIWQSIPYVIKKEKLYFRQDGSWKCDGVWHVIEYPMIFHRWQKKLFFSNYQQAYVEFQTWKSSDYGLKFCCAFWEISMDNYFYDIS